MCNLAKQSMDNKEKIDFKNRLKLHCTDTIQERIAASQRLMDEAQEAANSESKSSAGDKYETSRAMNHLAKDMHAAQLASNRQELAAVMNINCNSIAEKISTGCFIKTSGPCFFIAAGLGKLVLEDVTVFFLSPNVPLSALLIQKKKGDLFLFNKQSLLIEDIF